MIKIKDLITERQQYALGVKTTPWKDELLAHVIAAEDRDEVAFITVGSTLFEKRKIDAIQNKYSIVGAYKIGNIFTNEAHKAISVGDVLYYDKYNLNP